MTLHTKKSCDSEEGNSSMPFWYSGAGLDSIKVFVIESVTKVPRNELIFGGQFTVYLSSLRDKMVVASAFSG